jgi:OFA family oxalate/formate antiporter-like MFS transporter
LSLVKKHLRYYYLAFGSLAMFVLGLIYAWSIFALAFNLDRLQSSVVFSTTMICFCVGSIAAGYLNRSWGERPTILASAILLALGFCGIALLGSGFWALELFYGLCVGVSCGLGYNTIVTSVNLWFPEKTGFASGFQLMGFGLSALLLASPVQWAMAAFGWQAVFAAVAVIGMAVICGFACLIRSAPGSLPGSFVVADVPVAASDAPAAGGSVEAPAPVLAASAAPAASSASKEPPVIPPPSAIPPSAVSPPPSAAIPPPAVSQSHKPVLKDPGTYLFYVWRTLILAIGITLIGNAAIDAELLGFSNSSAALLVGFVALGNAVSRIIIGALYDKTGTHFVLLLVTGLFLVASAAIVTAFLIGSSLLFALAAVVLGFAHGSLPVIAATFARLRYGAENYSRNLGIINSNVAFGSFLSIGMAFVASNFDGLLEETVVYALCLACALASALFLLAFLRVDRKQGAVSNYIADR